jgi:formylglycine-generating enzyme required for sulfatase activity
LGLNDTTPVGIFPDGALPYSCLDMSGNVWQWTNDNLEDLRVLRGGSFVNNPDFTRCASRNWLAPYYRFTNVGFRVLVAPISH